MSFQVGDRVKWITFLYKGLSTGSEGVIKDIQSSILVKWDNFSFGHDGNGFEPGSKSYLFCVVYDLAKIGPPSSDTETVEEPIQAIWNHKHFFDTSDVFKPEVIDKIWEVTMGRPVTWPAPPPLPPEEKKDSSEIDYDSFVTTEEPLVAGCLLRAVTEASGGLHVGDIFEFIQMSKDDWSYAKVKCIRSSGVQVGYIGSWLFHRFKRIKSNKPIDNYFFAKRTSWTKEEIDDLWKATVEVSGG